MEQISYKIEVFEGPMDLLLHLIAKHKLNIYDIPILELVEQYIAYVQRMQEEDLYVASEFLEMAARLVYIKTVSLLPKYEEAETLKQELTGELLEYRDCQIMAGKLARQTDGFDSFVRKPMQVEIDPTYTRLHEAEELLGAYIRVVGKKMRKLPPPIEAFKGIVATKIVSVESKFQSIFQKLRGKGKKQRFRNLFTDAKSRSDMVATFLAVLELAKVKKLHLAGVGDNVEVELLSEDLENMDALEWE